ncbi:acrosomal protein KIAA1210 homolog isoform X2 [Eublepharis macularius]|uniref:Acrosomal protein KIAA1210 homolog isoform X2 n=2 Tax=Eublepharis macularius TaxID=481883 RepID=A0AA97LE49_EUBMA|nr:acrosomal protein KIAA1210 homolog isoform X2 [Eublepharis macularius]
MAGFYSCLKSNNDCIMASGPVDVLEPLEAEETGKKKSKFQTFKNFFAKKKKKKEPSSPGAESTLKPSQSSSDVSSTPHLDSSMLHLPTEPGSKSSMGNKALSHDSVFISESSPDTAGKTSSQENLSGKVKALQLQFQHTLQLRSPPLVIASKKTEDAGAISEDDGLPRSPPEISTLHNVLTCSTSKSSNPVQRHSSLSLGGTDSEDDQVPSEASSRPVSPLSSSVLMSPISPTCHLLSVDFNTPATPVGCLDTSAARHKIALNPRKQKAFNNRTQTLAVEKLEKEQCLLKTAAGKASHPKLLEDANHPEKAWEGSSIQNTNHLNESQINSAVPKPKTSNPLRYSWNFLPGPGGICISTSEGCVIETDFQDDNIAVPCPNVETSLTETELKMEEEGVKMSRCQAQCQTDGLKQNRKEEFEISEPLQTETETVVLCDVLLPALHSNGREKDFDSPAQRIHAQCPKHVDQKAKGFGNGSNATAQVRPDGGCSCVALGLDSQLYIPQFSPSASETPSEVGKSIVPSLEKSPSIKDDAADLESQSLADCLKPTVSPQEELAMLDISLDSTKDEKLCFPAELCCSALNNALGSQETELLKKACDSTVKDEISCRYSEVASESTPPNEDAREDPSDGMKVKEESKSSDEVVKIQLKSSSTKPVRFTIAPAWQRSLSGGSNSLDGSCPRSSPSSPVKSEFFEGIPDTATPGCTPNSLERFSGNNRNAAAMEGTKEEPQSRERPFGIKLRRTSSLLKYQTEQQHRELPKPGPPAASNISSAKDEPKLPELRKAPQDLSSSAKSLVMKSSFQEEKNASKPKSEEETAKQQTSRLPEKIPPTYLETRSSEPAWISMAKLKQRGFQDLPFSKEPKNEENALAQAEPGEEKNVGNSKLEKQPDAPSENLLKNSSTPTACARENKVQQEMPASSPTAPIRMVPQETACVEKEKRALPSLPISTCSPAEPPWLSLAKKKAKAWSEMPQMVQ